MASKRNGNASKKTAAAVTVATKPAQPAAAAERPTAAAAQPAQPAVAAAALPPVPSRTDGPSPGNLAFQWKARHDGAGELVVVYEGPLSSRDRVLARVGTCRSGGAPWADTQEVALTRAAPGRLVGAIPVRPGAPVQAVELAFHAGDEWDNGGRAPLGYYECSVREGQVVVR
jgi:hypothetical protein